MYGEWLMAPDHDHPVNPGQVAAARAGVLGVAEAGRLAGLLGMLADPDTAIARPLYLKAPDAAPPRPSGLLAAPAAPAT